MCGISGIWNKKAALQEEQLVRFNDSLTHRGPDGAGHRIFDDRFGLAHRRLSILDVTDSGAQPMSDHLGRYHISYNGEVFNFLELRRELEEKGRQFKSESDTEVILAAYATWGIDAFHRFNGMWAMAIWDDLTKELLLCRDRFGIKPLYFLDVQDLFAFASETNAFNALEGFVKSPNAQRLQIGLQDTYALEGRGYTIYEDIFQLLPGHFIRIHGGEIPDQKRWYHIEDNRPSMPTDYQTQVEQYRNLFRDACALRMRSDVPLATALSGGVDSTAVYSMVHHLMKEKSAQRVPEDWQRAFVAVFPGTLQDETEYAEAAVEFTGGKAEYLDPTTMDLVADIQRTTQHFDAISTTPILALMTVYRGMRNKGVVVSLDGHGVDEMLYGYRGMVFNALDYYKWHGSRTDAESVAQVLLNLYDPALRNEKSAEFRISIEQAFAMRKGLLSKVKRAVRGVRPGRPEIRPSDLLSPLSDRPYEFSHKNVFDEMVYNEFFLDTLPSLLRNFDKASMMSSIEIRMPFMDYRSVEHTFALPFNSKLGEGFTKRILRDAMKGIMPEKNRVRTYKVGLASPTMEWFQGPLKEWISDTVHSNSFSQPVHWEVENSRSMIERVEKNEWSVATASEVWKYVNADLILNGA